MFSVSQVAPAIGAYLNGRDVPSDAFNFGIVLVVEYSNDPVGRKGSTAGKLLWEDEDASTEADRMYSDGDDGSDATDRRAVLAIAMETFSVRRKIEILLFCNLKFLVVTRNFENMLVGLLFSI